MYLAEYDDSQLHGGFLRKLIKAPFKLVGKVVKAVAKPIGKVLKPVEKALRPAFKPAAHIAAAVVTGGRSIPISASILAAKNAKKMQEAQAKREQAEYAALLKPPPVWMPLPVAPPASPVAPVTTIAPQAWGVSAQPPVTYAQPPSAPAPAPAEYRERPQRAARAAPASPAVPPWVLPVGIGGAVLLAATVAMKSRKGR